MSHVTAYTRSKAISGVMLYIVHLPHTVTQILTNLSCFLEGFDLKSQYLTTDIF